jgi:uroporphyrinogen-III synthase
MTVFISREIKPESAFLKALNAQNIAVEGFSLLKLSPIPFLEIPESDWIFFYSQQGVAFFFKDIKEKKLAIPNRKWAAIGKITAQNLEIHLGKVDFIGNGNPTETAEQFKQIAAGTKILFPCALHSRHSIQSALKNDIFGINFPIYKNEVLEKIAPLPQDLLVFTSPLNAEAYFSKYKLLENQTTLAIGQTTAATLRKMTQKEPIIAAETTEISLAEAVLKHIR